MLENALFIPFIILSLLSVFLSSLSQVILKKAALRSYPSKIREYLNLPVVGAYTIFLMTTMLGIWVYKVIPLSLGLILETTGYVYVTIFGVKLFGEKLNRKKIIALVLIISGIVIYISG